MSVHLARAKVNLRLTVLAREESGYHQIETLFCALELADEIEIDVGGAQDRIELVVEGAELGPPENNLAHRAARAFFAAADRKAALRIVLRKRIPAGAGLGGGSSDAATTLRALNAAFADPLPQDALLAIAAELGSDVPFFVTGAPFTLAWGRGQRLLPLPPPPSQPVLVVAPRRPIATADAYGWLARRRAAASAATQPTVHDVARFSDWDAIADSAVNDFEPVVFERAPELADLRDALAAAGARPALLSGSGSALFGVFASESALHGAREAVKRVDPEAHTITTRTIASPLLAPPLRR